MPDDKVLTPLQLWARLIKEAGLELRLKRQPGRDADLEESILEQLDPAAGTVAAQATVKALLKFDRDLPNPTITVEHLVSALLTSQKGFGAMMTQILETLVMAQATVSETPLTFAFQFDSLTGPLKLTLEQFQAHVDRTRRTNVMRFMPLNQQQRWEINSALSDMRDHEGAPRGDDLPEKPQVITLPTPEKFREPLRTLQESVAEFLKHCRAVGLSRTDNFWRLRQRQGSMPLTVEQKEEFDRVVDATDFWDLSIVDSINYIKKGLNTRDLNPDRTYEILMRAVRLIPVKQQWVNERYRELLDILNLPTWKHRHELYSVWVGTQLLNVAKTHANNLEFHPQNNVLSFAFGGSVLASYVANAEHFSIHCELRSDLIGTSRKRKQAIQPDFRVLREDVTATSNDATRLVLECKHYLRANAANFSSAASDYARSCSYATVLVVNHGPVEEAKLLASMAPPLQNRTRFIGDATPDAPDELQAFLRATLFSEPTIAPISEAPHASSSDGTTSPLVFVSPGHTEHLMAAVRVEWDEQLEDIDLALAFTPFNGDEMTTLNFMNRGGETAPFHAQLMEDVRSGPGTETINIYKFCTGTYEITVRNYSNPGHFPAAHLRGCITLGTTTLIVHPPESGVHMDDWRMATLGVNEDGTLTIHT